MYNRTFSTFLSPKDVTSFSVLAKINFEILFVKFHFLITFSKIKNEINDQKIVSATNCFRYTTIVIKSRSRLDNKSKILKKEQTGYLSFKRSK